MEGLVRVEIVDDQLESHVVFAGGEAAAEAVVGHGTFNQKSEVCQYGVSIFGGFLRVNHRHAINVRNVDSLVGSMVEIIDHRC